MQLNHLTGITFEFHRYVTRSKWFFGIWGL